VSRYYIPTRTAIALRVKDGVVLAVEKLVHSKLLVPAANRRVQTIDRHIGLVRSRMYHCDPRSQPLRLAPDSWLMDDTSPTERETRPQTIATIIASRHLLRSIALVLSAHFPVSPFYMMQALADRLSLYVQAYTLYSSVRPFGCSTILGGVDKDGPSIYVIEPSGVFYVRMGCHTSQPLC
jgi:20S proteasome subunit alpha 7